MPSRSSEQRHALVAALLTLPDITDLTRRHAIVRQLETAGVGWIHYASDPRLHLDNIVFSCAADPRGLSRLRTALACFYCDATAFQPFCRLLDQRCTDSNVAVQRGHSLAIDLQNPQAFRNDRASFRSSATLSKSETAAIPASIPSLQDAKEAFRASTSRASGAIGPAAEDVPALIIALAHEQEPVRSSAAHDLGRIGPSAAQAIPALITTLRDLDWYVGTAAARALDRIGPAAVPALITALEDNEADVRTSVLKILGNIGPAAAPATPDLIALLANKDSNARFYAAWALGRIGPAATPSIPALIIALRDDDKHVRNITALALARLGPAGNEALRRHLPAQ